MTYPGSASPKVRFAAAAAAFAALYFVTAELTSSLAGDVGIAILWPASGVYLEIVKNERIVWSDAYTAGWQPSQKPFMTAIITFEDAGAGKTKYTARARHWTVADREAHEKMGFQQGWSMCLDQLVAMVKKG